jgi:hypothetical protein
MSDGRTTVSQSTFGLITDLVTGGGAMPHYIYFYPENGGDSIRLDLYDPRPAFYCSSCEAFLIAGTESRPKKSASSGQ